MEPLPPGHPRSKGTGPLCIHTCESRPAACSLAATTADRPRTPVARSARTRVGRVRVELTTPGFSVVGSTVPVDLAAPVNPGITPSVSWGAAYC